MTRNSQNTSKYTNTTSNTVIKYTSNGPVVVKVQAEKKSFIAKLFGK